MQFLLNNEVQKISQVNTEQLVSETAKLYQSIFAMEPWNEAGIDSKGNPIEISRLHDGFTPFHSIQSISWRIREVIDSPESIFLISATQKKFTINSEILTSIQPISGEFVDELNPVEINKRQLFINGFLWATQMPTVDILITRGDFRIDQARVLIDSQRLQQQSIFINEMAIDKRFQQSNVGRKLKDMLEIELDSKKLPVFANAIMDSGAFKLFEQMGGRVISGPGVHDKESYVLSMKKY